MSDKNSMLYRTKMLFSTKNSQLVGNYLYFYSLKQHKMSYKSSNFKTFYQNLNIIYSAIFFGLISFMTVAYFVSKEHQLYLNQDDAMMIYISLAGAILLYFASIYIKKTLTKQARTKEGLQSKLHLYMTYYTVNLALVEGYGLLNTVWFLTTHNLAFLIFAAYAILLFLLMKPNPDKIMYLLELDATERTYINDIEKPFT